MARKLDMTPEERRLRDQAFNAARGVADKALRDKHIDEWSGYYQADLAERGYQWSPKRKPEDVALDQITQLLTDYPELADKLADRLVLGTEATSAQR
jgi:hypothetical protein